METTVNERIAQIISQCGYKSKRSFAEKIGVAQTSLNDILRGAEPKYSTDRNPLRQKDLYLQRTHAGHSPQYRNEMDRSQGLQVHETIYRHS